MINPGRVDGSICGAVLSTKSATVWKLAGAATSTTGQRRLGSTVVASGTRQRTRKPAGVYCPKSTSWLLSTFVPELESCSARRLPVYPRANVRFSSTESTAPRAATIEAIDESRTSHEALPTKGELLSYVSGVGGYSADERFDYHRDTYRRGYASPDGANVQISDRKGDVQYPNSTEIARASNATEELVVRLCTAIRQRLRHPQRITLSSIYKIYCRLPEPRMLNLTWQWRNRLMKIMGTPRTKDKGGMIRYFELVADVRDAGLTMRRAEWNYGLAFAASYAATTTTQELDTTLQLWREMEKEHNLSGNDVTFNVLFDAASKAGNFVLAEMIYDEMESRGIEFNRYHHVSLIHFFGLKMDADGLRAAYKEMVDAGEMIDTVALNCVIAGLLRCGEEDAAEHTYDRMKEGNALAPDMPQRDYMLGRVITKVLMMFTKVGKAHPQMRNSFQTKVMVSPDIHTFRLLIEHYAIRIGDIGKVAQYLDEMKLLKIPVHPTIFLALFKGFFSYGGYEGSMWSAQRLQDVLNALYLARDQNTPNFQIDTWLVIWALRAVKKCSSLEDVVDTFAALEQRWDVVPNRQVYMHEVFDNILRDKDVKIKWRGLDSSKTRASQTKLIEF